MTYVYAHLATDGSVLYVGQTSYIDKRTQQHRTKAPWWPMVAEVVVLADFPYPKALRRECELIEQYEPPFNRVGTREWLTRMRQGLEDIQAPPLTAEQLALVKAAFRSTGAA